jgi:hypothetical protein
MHISSSQWVTRTRDEIKTALYAAGASLYIDVNHDALFWLLLLTLHTPDAYIDPVCVDVPMAFEENVGPVRAVGKLVG